MHVQVRDVMTQDEGIHVLGGSNLHEGAGRQRLERTNAFRLVGPKVREARDVPFGFDEKPTEVDAIGTFRDEGVADEDQLVLVDRASGHIDSTRVAIAHQTAHGILHDEAIPPRIAAGCQQTRRMTVADPERSPALPRKRSTSTSVTDHGKWSSAPAHPGPGAGSRE